MTVSPDTNPRLHIPIIDISELGALISATGEKRDRHTKTHQAIAAQIGHACREYGFFYITRHGIDETLQQRLEELSRQFFAQDLETKMAIEMERGGKAWRGYFPVGGELTSGRPDLKEGIYFGAELDQQHPLVQADMPLHGANLFPASLPELREVVLAYMAAMTRLGHILMAGIALSLGLEASYFSDRYTTDPLILFRIFNYPSAVSATSTAQWGVGEHTDYGILTILKQDETGGLQIKSQSQWIDAPPLPNTFVCNIGDMLERMTGGLYRSTPHRVKNSSGRDRLSFPFFFDPNFNVEVKPIAEIAANSSTGQDQESRWDKANVHTFQGTYGDYVLGKVSKVFPILRRTVL